MKNALINTLTKKGWEEQIIQYPTEEDLIKNWASILFENNKEIDRLNNIPLTNSEMAQIFEQIAELKTQLKLNGLINGKTISVTKNNPKDTLHMGHEVSLKIYDRNEIAAGQSRYQIVRQPKFKAKSTLLNNRRGDFMLLINGMPLFHSAELIANSGDADKVIFLIDRIELGTQSLKEYRNFANENEKIRGTENTNILITKLKSPDYHDTLIVTSIQKMSNIKNEEDGLNTYDISIMNSKRIVFIVDEAHRSTFGDMLITIKQTFPNAIFFGFTGTPIQEENQKKMNEVFADISDLFSKAGSGDFTKLPEDKIDVDYMNSLFTKYLKILSQENVTEEQLEQGLNDLHKSFAFLTQKEQKYANIFIHDVQMGNVEVDSNISFREYVSLYQHNAENEQVSHLCSVLGLDEKKLRSMMNCCLTENNINEFGRFDELKAPVDKAKAKDYFEQVEGKPVSPFAVNIKIQNLLQEFLLGK